jgi:hypothetical protein
MTLTTSIAFEKFIKLDRIYIDNVDGFGEGEKLWRMLELIFNLRKTWDQQEEIRVNLKSLRVIIIKSHV